MPIYEYECQNCGHVIEKLSKHDDPAPICINEIETQVSGALERCAGETKKIVSLNTFHLKGQGWYKDGY